MKDNQRLLEFLRAELEAIETRNYARSPRQPWRARLAFEDSPYCLNHDKGNERVSCEQCVLIDMVPRDRRREKVPCRFIPLNGNGDTVDSLYRSGTQQELEAALARWLRRNILRLELEERAAGVHYQLPPFRQAKELVR
jgi:hypothetical protein